MHHGHDHAHAGLDRALALTAGFAIIELAGGWLADSLALMADAAHMVSDVAALALAAVAGRIAARPAHDGMSYGYGRARVLAAQANGFGLWFVAGWIAWEASCCGSRSSSSERGPNELGGSLRLGKKSSG